MRTACQVGWSLTPSKEILLQRLVSYRGIVCDSYVRTCLSCRLDSPCKRGPSACVFKWLRFALPVRNNELTVVSCTLYLASVCLLTCPAGRSYDVTTARGRCIPVQSNRRGWSNQVIRFGATSRARWPGDRVAAWPGRVQDHSQHGVYNAQMHIHTQTHVQTHTVRPRTIQGTDVQSHTCEETQRRICLLCTCMCPL